MTQFHCSDEEIINDKFQYLKFVYPFITTKNTRLKYQSKSVYLKILSVVCYDDQNKEL